MAAGIFSLGAALIGAIGAKSAAKTQAAAASAQNAETMAFNRDEAAKARDWQAMQDAIDRDWSAAQTASAQAYQTNEARIARDWEAQQASIANQFTHSENQLAMNWNAQQNALDRQFNASEAEKARQFNANQQLLAQQYNSAEALKTRQFNAQEADKARQFDLMMSNTSHQREMADLKAAGLNPILAANGGAPIGSIIGASGPSASVSALSGPAASSGSGRGASGAQGHKGNASSAQGQIAGHGSHSAQAASVGMLNRVYKGNFLGDFVHSAMDGVRLENDMKRAKAELMNAEAHAKDAETNKLRQAADERHINSQIDNLKADSRWKDFMSNTEAEKVNLIKEQIISEVKHQWNESRLTDAQVAQAGAIAYQAVKNADTEAAYKSIMGKVAEAQSDCDKERLLQEAHKLKLEYDQGMKKTQRDFYDSFGGKITYIVDQVVGACSPIKFKF